MKTPHDEAPPSASDFYRPGKSIAAFHRSLAWVRFLIGGRGCLAFETPIFDPIHGDSVAIGERAIAGKSFHVLALTPRGIQSVRCTAPFAKGRAALLRVTLENGKEYRCASEHRFLTPVGWQPLSLLSAGMTVAYSRDPLPTNEGISPKGCYADEWRWNRTASGYQGDCSHGHRPGDGRPQRAEESAQVCAPSPAGAHEHIRHYWPKDGRELSPASSRIYPQSARLSKSHFDPAGELCSGAGDPSDLLAAYVECRVFSGDWKSIVHCTRAAHQFPQWSGSYRHTADATEQYQTKEVYEACRESIDWTRIIHIEVEQSAATYYDLTVPGAGNYWADGAWHHNSGKTSGTAMECIRHLWDNPGGKALIVRKTEVSNTDTTVETFNNLFAAMGSAYREGTTGLFKSWNGGRTFRVPSHKAIQLLNEWTPTTGSPTELAHFIETELARYCGHIEMRGLPDKKKSENKLRGFECSIMALVEADLLEHGDFTMAIPCVRMRGPDGEFITDGGLIVETNPPSPRHWIAKLEEETKNGEHPDYEFWHLKTDENRHNLRPGYVEDVKAAYRNNPAMYNRMVNGEYDEAFSGMPVMHAFREEHAGEDLPWPHGAVLVRGWDFGTRNAVIWSAYWEHEGIEYWHDLYEQILVGSDTDRQAREALQTTENEFPFWNDRNKCSGVLDFCDPAGVNSAFTRQIEVNGKTVKESPVNILRTYGINPGFRTTARGLEETLSIVNRLMEAKDRAGRFVYRIDKLFCPNLYRGHKGAYRYPEEGEVGHGSNQPLKGILCDHVDHVCFVAGTKVLTQQGQTPIERVKAGDYALTRTGWKQVTKAEMTHAAAEVLTLKADDFELTGTAEHPIWIEGYGWKRLAACIAGDRIAICRTLSASHSMASPTRSCLYRPTRGDGNTTQTEQNHSIAQSGSTATDLSRKECTYTTAMETPRTTPLKTWNASIQPIIQKSIGAIVRWLQRRVTNAVINSSLVPRIQCASVQSHASRRVVENQALITSRSNAERAESKWSAADSKSGEDSVIDAQAKKQQNTSQKQSRVKRNASDAPSRSLTTAVATAGDSVRESAPEQHAELQDWMTLNTSAPTAAESSWPTKTTIESIALTRAPQKRAGTQAVFNITVEDAHEYFANGILVSNCDASRYAKINCLRLIKSDREALKAPPTFTKTPRNPNPDRWSRR